MANNKLDAAQRKYVEARIEEIVKTKTEASLKKHTVKGVSLNPEQRVAAIKAGKFKLKPGVVEISRYDDVINVFIFTDEKPEKVNNEAHLKDVIKIKRSASQIMDELMLCDAESALKKLQAFERDSLQSAQNGSVAQQDRVAGFYPARAGSSPARTTTKTNKKEMKMFKKIESAYAIINKNGLYQQVDLYTYNERIFVRYGDDFARIVKAFAERMELSLSGYVVDELVLPEGYPVKFNNLGYLVTPDYVEAN